MTTKKLNTKKERPSYESMKFTDSLLIKTVKPWHGNLKVNAFNKKGELEGSRDLGENLATNNAKIVMAHLIAQSASTDAGTLTNVAFYDPRIFDSVNGGIAGGVSIEGGSSFNPTAIQLRTTYMAFGTNQLDAGGDGPSVAVAQYGLFNAIAKNGYSANDGSVTTASNYFYGGSGSTTYQFLPTSGLVSDGIVRITTRMLTTEGQLAAGGSTAEYKEAGLFTSLFHTYNGQSIPLMIARKTFSTITKSSDIELQLVWEMRF